MSGKTWQHLKLPETIDDSGNLSPFENKYGDTLNLHLEKTQTDIGYYAPSIVSKESYPGYILAQGSISRTIEEIPERLGLFFSTEGGRNWRETKPSGLSGRFHTNILDSGAITIAIQMNRIN